MSDSPVSGFDGVQIGEASSDGCDECGHPYHEHGKEKVFPEDGPPGSSHYTYICPEA